LAMLAVPDDGAATDAVVREQVDRKGLLPDADVFQPDHPVSYRPHDFLTGGIAQCMDNAIVTMTAFASQGEAALGRVEAGSPTDQLLDPPRSLANHAPYNLGVAERAAGLERVGYVIFK